MEIEGLDKVLVDTSAWIEFFKKKEPYYSMVLELIDDNKVYCTGIILAELFQGAKSEKELVILKDFMHVFYFIPEELLLWEKAGELSYKLRRKGKLIGLSDCYIAAAAALNDAELLTLDKHFDKIKNEIGLTIYCSG